MTEPKSDINFIDMERVNSVSHVLADLVQQMYYKRNSSGLDVVIKNLSAITSRRRIVSTVLKSCMMACR